MSKIDSTSRRTILKERIARNLTTVLHSGFIPELGKHTEGKVRDVHLSNDNLVMVASDRVSAFDKVLSRRIPYKGMVLNEFNRWAMQLTADIVQNASLQSPDPNVVIQRAFPNVGFELIVRGYVWGSLAADYEAGQRTKSGIALPDGLFRYQKLENPIFTPTTKAERGKHDVDITLDDIVKVHGQRTAEALREISLRLYDRGVTAAERAGMILLDTKFEFGLDGNDRMIVLIDESLTPDSSRYCSKSEYERKWVAIAEEMKTGQYKDVTALLIAHPELKIKEESKQYVRDVLVEGGYREGSPLPELTDAQVVETAVRYVELYERLTGKQFNFGESDLPTARQRIMNNLVKAGVAYGGCIVPMGASEKDKEHWGKLEKALQDTRIPFVAPFFASAHKETQRVLDFVKDMDRRSIEPLVYLTFAGRSNGLGPVVAGNTNYPVITCPIFSDAAAYAVDIHSSMRMPSRLPLMTIVEPSNAALAAKRIIDILR